VEIAWIWAEVSSRGDVDPIPPTLRLIADWIVVAGDPFFPLPWQPEQNWV
jgi:hypothetical protein